MTALYRPWLGVKGGAGETSYTPVPVVTPQFQSTTADTVVHFTMQAATGTITNMVSGASGMVVNAAWSHAVTGPGGGIPYALGMTSAPATTTFAAAITLTSGDFSVNIIARANAGINIDLESAFFFLYGTNEVRGSTWTSTYSYQWGYNFYDGLGYKYAMYPKTSLCDVFTDGNWHQITYKFKRDEAKAIVMIDGSTLSHSVDGGTLSAYSDLDFQFDEVRFAYPPTNLNMTIAEFWLAKTLTVTQYTFPVSA